MATAQRLTRYQREVAERNVEAILDAAEDLLQQGQANISAVAVQAGVSRVTVYAHFPTWEALLEAGVERAVRRTMVALQSVHSDDGPSAEALDRMIAAAWQHLARYGAMAAAVAELLSPEAVARSHQAAHHTIGALLKRGQADGSFRTDLPARWLITACIALMHACAEPGPGRPDRRARRGPHPHHLAPRPVHRNPAREVPPSRTLNQPPARPPTVEGSRVIPQTGAVTRTEAVPASAAILPGFSTGRNLSVRDT